MRTLWQVLKFFWQLSEEATRGKACFEKFGDLFIATRQLFVHGNQVFTGLWNQCKIFHHYQASHSICVKFDYRPWSVGTWDLLFTDVWGLLCQAQPLNVVHWVCLMLLKLVYSLRKCVNQLSSPATRITNWPVRVKKIKLQIFCKLCDMCVGRRTGYLILVNIFIHLQTLMKGRKKSLIARKSALRVRI